MSASMTETKIHEGGHSGPPVGVLEKPSELGRLPADWRMVPLREAYSFTKKPRGLTIPLDCTIPFLPMDAIPIGCVSVSAFEERPSSKLTSGTYIENGDLLVAKITPSFENRKQAIVKWDRPFGFATTEVIPIQEIKGISDKHYLFHILLHSEIRADLAGKMEGTTGRQRLSKEVLGAKQIPLPPLAEQRKIAGVLGLVQRAIEQQERLIALTTELKKTLLHKLFAEGLHGEPQKQTDIGPLPKSWEVVPLESVFHTQLGKMLSQKARTGNDPKPYLRNKNVQWGVIDTTDLLSMDFNERECEKFALVPGDLLICEGGEPGRAAIWHGELKECYYQKALHRLRPKSDTISNEFLAHWLEFALRYQDLYGVAGASSTIAHLPEVQLKMLQVPLPKRNEQDTMVESLNAVDNKVALHRCKHDTLSALFQTLLHQLMTAKLRIPDLDLPEFSVRNGKE